MHLYRTFWQLEQVADMLEDAGRQVGLTLGKDYFFGLDVGEQASSAVDCVNAAVFIVLFIGASQLYDAKKERYDVGGAKSSSELVSALPKYKQFDG
jgi:hypothetical protein